MNSQNAFTIRLYFDILQRLLKEPRLFFSSYQTASSSHQTLYFLLFSGLFHATASVMIYPAADPLLVVGILFVNAVGMCFISTILGFAAIIVFTGRRPEFSTLFNIYALSWGITLLASWIPFFIYFTEPWKWWLIAMGIKRRCGISTIKCMFIIVFSIGFIAMLFRYMS